MGALVSVALTGALISSGCGGESTSQATPPPARAASAQEKCASEIYRCTRLTIQNESGNWIKVMADGRDQGSQTIGIGSGSVGAVSGYWGAWGGVDMSGEVWDLDRRTSAYHKFEARNPQVGFPSVGFWNAQNRETHFFSVGETHTFALMENRAFDVTREPDSEHFIEFRANYRQGQ
jgi:hypothetical protein